MNFKLETWLANHKQAVSKTGKNQAMAEAIKNAARDLKHSDMTESEFESIVDALVSEF